MDVIHIADPYIFSGSAQYSIPTTLTHKSNTLNVGQNHKRLLMIFI